jgi:DNA-binding LytR/AlgR family response regulator
VSPLRALIVDDEPLAQRYLAELLLGTGLVELAAVVGSVAQAEVAASELTLDVAFVDIRLVDRPGDTSGLVWSRALLARPAPPLLVLATAMPDHALDAFDAGAVDYLLKPFTRHRVATCVERLRARCAAPPPAAAPARLLARTGQTLVFLSLTGVLAFEAAERLTYVHHADGRYLVDLSLTALEAQLGSRVVRAHRNWLVALDQVRELTRADGELALLVGADLEVSVSRDRAAAVRDALTRHAVGARR